MCNSKRLVNFGPLWPMVFVLEFFSLSLCSNLPEWINFEELYEDFWVKCAKSYPLFLFLSPPRPGQLKLKSLCYLRIVIRNGVLFCTWIILFSLSYKTSTDIVLLTECFGVFFLYYYIGMALPWLTFIEITMVRSESVQIMKCI